MRGGHERPASSLEDTELAVKAGDGVASALLGPPTPDAGRQDDDPHHQQKHQYQDGHDLLDLPSVVTTLQTGQSYVVDGREPSVPPMPRELSSVLLDGRAHGKRHGSTRAVVRLGQLRSGRALHRARATYPADEGGDLDPRPAQPAARARQRPAERSTTRPVSKHSEIASLAKTSSAGPAATTWPWRTSMAWVMPGGISSTW